MLVTLAGKTAIVTGASSGIGRAITQAYLASGIQGVIAVDQSKDPGDPLVASADADRERVHVVQGDVSDDATWTRAVSAAREHFGGVDILVSNAGRSVVKPLHLHTPEEWDDVMNTNVRALYLAARHVLPVMMEQGSGVVLITGSISGSAGIPTQGAYAPSKGALHQMARQMAVEYARYGVRVNAIACGTVDTPIVHRSAEASGDAAGYWKMLREAHPIGRIAQADEVANFFTYMASDLASFFTGAVLTMDGGYTAQ